MLGTGNAMCVNCYNTCFYLRSPKGGMLVDGGGGNGILQQLIKARIPFENIFHMFVTHCHTDHIMGAIWMMRKISDIASGCRRRIRSLCGISANSFSCASLSNLK